MLSDARNRLSKVLSNKKFIVILVVTFVFIVAAVYTYRRYVVPRLKPAYVPNKEFTSGNVMKDQGLQTCTSSIRNGALTARAAMPIWAKLKEEVGDGRS